MKRYGEFIGIVKYLKQGYSVSDIFYGTDIALGYINELETTYKAVIELEKDPKSKTVEILFDDWKSVKISDILNKERLKTIHKELEDYRKEYPDLYSTSMKGKLEKHVIVYLNKAVKE